MQLVYTLIWLGYAFLRADDSSGIDVNRDGFICKFAAIVGCPLSCTPSISVGVTNRSPSALLHFAPFQRCSSLTTLVLSRRKVGDAGGSALRVHRDFTPRDNATMGDVKAQGSIPSDDVDTFNTFAPRTVDCAVSIILPPLFSCYLS